MSTVCLNPKNFERIIHLTFYRKPNYNLAKDLPLNLFHCEYNDIHNWVYDESNLSHVICTLQKLWTISSIK